MNVFIAGPRAVSKLNNTVKERLKNIINNNFTVLVGDANGVDKQIQLFCHLMNYDNVKVFASNGKARNNIGDWDIQKVEVASNVKGFDFYAAKDFEMAKLADYGFMIWNGTSKGTLNNICNLVSMNKKVLVYFIPNKDFYIIRSLSDIEKLIKSDVDENRIIHEDFEKKSEQLSFF